MMALHCLATRLVGLSVEITTRMENEMNWLDRPISSKTNALLSCIGLGFSAWILGNRVGMGTFEAITFATILASSVGGLVDYAVTARK
jgi:hypothetical protein